jgi:hypothetical protein
MTVEQAIVYALDGLPPHAAPSRPRRFPSAAQKSRLVWTGTGGPRRAVRQPICGCPGVNGSRASPIWLVIKVNGADRLLHPARTR